MEKLKLNYLYNKLMLKKKRISLKLIRFMYVKIYVT